MSRLSRRDFARLALGGAALISLPQSASGVETPAADNHEQILAFSAFQRSPSALPD
jgi:hypothetical protein